MESNEIFFCHFFRRPSIKINEIKLNFQISASCACFPPNQRTRKREDLDSVKETNLNNVFSILV